VTPAIVHASTVAFGPEGGILIEGPSGSGKSWLAMMLIDQGADLVSDDRTVLMADGGAVFARAPRPIAGLIEVRGLGLVRLAARRLARVRLVVDLAAATETASLPRLPPPSDCRRLGCAVDRIAALRPSVALVQALATAMRGASGGRALPLVRA
jgi:HPr kinase/phosphorylase